MTQRDKMEAPSKKPKISSMTHEEEEQKQHDISKLRDQVQQISLSQKVTKAKMDGLKNNMEAKMDGIEAKLTGNIEYLKMDLKKLLQQILTNDERVVKETHDENKRNVSHDCIDCRVGLNTHHVPKIDMMKFDGKDPVTWIVQMGQYFDLHNVQNTQKVCIATLYLEPNQFVWYLWLFSHKKIVTWAIFTKEMIGHYEDTKSNNFCSQLINLKQKGSMVEHIEDFQKLNIRVKDIPYEHRIDVSIGNLKDNIQHEVHLWELDSLKKSFRLARKIERKIMATRNPTTHNYKDGSVVSPILTQPNNWKKKEEKGFVIVVIENKLKVISVLRRNYFT